MLADEVFYKIFRDKVVEIQHNDVDEKKEGKQDEVKEGHDQNDGNDNAGKNLNAADNDEGEN